MCRDSSSVNPVTKHLPIFSSGLSYCALHSGCQEPNILLWVHKMMYKNWNILRGLFKEPWALASFPSFPLTPKNHRIIFTPEKCHFTRCWPHFHHVHRASRQRLDQQSFLYRLDFTIFHVGNILQQRLHLMIQRYFIPKTWKNWKTNKHFT